MTYKLTEPTVTRRQYRDALKRGKVLIVGTNLTRNGWTEFSVYIVRSMRGGRIGYQACNVPSASYYSDYGYKCAAWGTDRRLEVILSIGYALGLKFHEIDQNYHWIQG